MKRVAILGGTGDLGFGLALRLARAYDVAIGSRDPAKAEEAAKKASAISGAKISGLDNEQALARSEIAILAIPDVPSSEFLASLRHELRDKLVVSPIVPMEYKDNGFSIARAAESATERVALSLPQARVAGAFHTVPARQLSRIEQELEYDVLVTADSRDVFEQTAELVSSIRNLRPLYAGPLRVSRTVEALTPLLLNVARLNHLRDPSFKVV